MSRRCLLFTFQRKLYILFSISFLIFSNSINLAYVSQLGNEDLISDYYFTTQRESHSVPDMGFLLTFNYFVSFGLSRIDLPRLKSNILMEIVPILVVLVHEFYFYVHHPIQAWIFEKIIFEKVYLFHIVLKSLVSLLRQVISLKKMVLLSVKFTILISWCPICISFIFLLALMKLESNSATILYNSMESRHPWRTNIRIKGSDRKPFILILDSILLYATLIM